MEGGREGRRVSGLDVDRGREDKITGILSNRPSRQYQAEAEVHLTLFIW